MDNAENLRAIGEALLVDGVASTGAGAGSGCESPAPPPRLTVLVELNVGHNRCGVSTVEEVVALATLAQSLPYCAFGGIHAYQGMAQHIRATVDRVESGEALTVRVGRRGGGLGVACRNGMQEFARVYPVLLASPSLSLTLSQEGELNIE